MNAMRGLLLLIAAVTLGFAACNYTDGECWYYGEGSENAGVGPGGGVIIPTGPTGVGGYGEAPPKQPQDAANPPPVCNIVSLSPCHDKCDEESGARAIECAKIQDEAQRRACQESSFEKYESCREDCERNNSDCKKCKLECDAEHDRCHAKCKDAACHAKCNNAYGKCLKECGDCPH
jgi:hypothetical protein